MDLLQVVQKFNGGKRLRENSYQCKCTAHRDDKESLTITEKNGVILLYCHAGCKFNNIISSVGLTKNDLGTQKRRKNYNGKK